MVHSFDIQVKDGHHHLPHGAKTKMRVIIRMNLFIIIEKIHINTQIAKDNSLLKGNSSIIIFPKETFRTSSKH